MLTRPIVERLLRVVLTAEHPHLLGALGPDQVAHQRRAEAAVPRADARAGLPEARVVGGDRQVAAEVQHVPAADRVAGDHRDDGLGQAAHLDLEVGDVEAADRLALGDVARVAAHALVAAGAEGQLALAGEDDHADVGVAAGAPRRRRRARGCVCGRNALRTSGRAIVIFAIPSPLRLVADVLVVACEVQVHHAAVSYCPMVDWLERAAARRPDHAAVGRRRRDAHLRASCSSARERAEPLEPCITHPPGLDFAVAPARAAAARGASRSIASDRATRGTHRRAAEASCARSDDRRAEARRDPAANVEASAAGACSASDHDDRWLCPLPLTTSAA